MQQPNSLHSDFLRHDLLMVYRQRWLFFSLLILFSGIGTVGLIGMDAARVWHQLVATGEISSKALLLLAGCLSFVLFLLVGGGSLKQHTPKRYRVQTFVFWPRTLINWLASCVVLLLVLMVIMALYTNLAEQLTSGVLTEAQQKENRKLLFGYIALIFLAFVVGGLAATWLFRRGLGYLSIFWKHVRLTGFFDQESYRLGDRIRFSLKDRVSLGSKQPYRIHLNYVQESRKRNQDNKDDLVREIVWSAYQDQTAGALHEGIWLDLPASRNVQNYITDFSSQLPITYWEVLVEGEKAPFFARYFINVRFQRPEVNVN